jgi:hypothetical protein
VSNINWLVLYAGQNETKVSNDRYGSLTRSKRTLKYFKYLDGRDSYLLGKKGGTIPRFLDLAHSKEGEVKASVALRCLIYVFHVSI